MLPLAILLLILVAIWFVVTQPLVPVKRRGSEVEVGPEQLEAHVRMLSETLVPRDAAHTGNLDRAAAYIRGAFELTGGRVSEQAYQIGDRTYRNVILQLGPETAERIVVGAHYDALGATPGADDNASGVAGLIELADLLGRADLPLAVELVAYTLEEPPFFRSELMGSAVHARALKEQSVPVRLMISLEMIGTFSDAPGSQRFPVPWLKLFYPSQGNFVGVIGKLSSAADVRTVKKAMRGATELPVYSFNAPPFLFAGIDFSDHLCYWNNGYRALMVTDTAFLRNRHYHTEGDTADRLDYARMSDVVVGVYETILALAR
jgi:Zn-dependent M28 family amino/carboxypeptidase